MLMLTVIFGAGAMTYFEGIPDAEDNAEFNLENSLTVLPNIRYVRQVSVQTRDSKDLLKMSYRRCLSLLVTHLNESMILNYLNLMKIDIWE